MIEIVPYLPNWKLRALAGRFARPIHSLSNPCYEKEVLEATAVIFECSLRGFHTEARNIILTNDTHFDNFRFLTPDQLSTGDKALKAAGTEVDHIYLIHMLATTRNAASLTSDETNAYRENIRWALKGFPAEGVDYPGQAVSEAETIANFRGNGIVKWEIRKHNVCLQPKAHRPLFTSAVAYIGPRKGP